MDRQRSLLVITCLAASGWAAAGCSGGGHGGSIGFASTASTASSTPVAVTSSVVVTAPTVSSTTGAFFLVSPLTQGRIFHTASALPLGPVLIAGGQIAPGAVTNTTESLDPTTGLTSAGPMLTVARMNHAAVVLPTGDLLVIGGQSDTACQETLNSTEILTAGSSAFAAGPTLASSRSNPAVALYQDSSGSWKVLVAGGASMDSGSLQSLDTAEVYDVATQTIAPAPATLTQDVVGARAVSLGSGQILLAGGYTQIGGGAPVVADSEILDMNAGSVTQFGMIQDRAECGLATDGNGTAYAIGGTSGSAPLASVETTTGLGWSQGTSLANARLGLSAVAVPIQGASAGQAILVVGGLDGAGPVGACELVNAAAGASAPTLMEARGYAAVAVLANGNLVVAGGTDGIDILSSIEVFSPTGSSVPGAGSTLGPLVSLQGSGTAASTLSFNGATFWDGATFLSTLQTTTNTTTTTPTTSVPPAIVTNTGTWTPGLPANPNDQAHLTFALGVINAARATQNLPALTLDAGLSATALQHATDDQSVQFGDSSGGPCHDFNSGNTGGATAENVDAFALGHHHHGGGGQGWQGSGNAPAQLSATPPADITEADFLRFTRRMLSASYAQLSAQLFANTPGAVPNYAGGASENANLMNPSVTAVGIGFYVDTTNGRLIICEDLR
jgi:uncharacterized protein YkwD